MLAAVRAAAAEAGRAEDAVMPGLYARVIVAETREAAERAIDGSLLMRFIALTRPAEAFAARGAEHPLGERAFGLTTFMPTAYGRAEALALAERVPPQVVRDSVIHGTPDVVAAIVGAFVARGARHVQLTNMTPLAAPAMAGPSEALLADTVAALRTGGPAEA
jgi:phthiodiolone/phenolphthiodiolone dimycocerosates ketoreductase